MYVVEIIADTSFGNLLGSLCALYLGLPFFILDVAVRFDRVCPSALVANSNGAGYGVV